MWPFRRKSAEDIRRDIERDPDLTPEQKGTALARLSEKTRAIEPFQPERIASTNRGIFHALLPATVGKVQLERVKVRNQLIAEATETVNRLAEAKKSWHRLQHIDEEIAAGREIMALTFLRDSGKLKGEAAEAMRRRARTERLSDVDQVEDELRLEKAQHELAEFRRQRNAPPPVPPTTAERLAEIDADAAVRRRQAEHQKDLAMLQRFAELVSRGKLDGELIARFLPSAEERKADRRSDIDKYRAALDEIRKSDLSETEKVMRAVVVGHEYGFDRDPAELWAELNGAG